MTKKIEYAFNVDGLHHSINYYRNTIPTAISNLASPTETGITGTSFTDSTPIHGEAYAVRFGSVRGDVEKISDEVYVQVGDDKWLNTVALLNFEDGLIDVTSKRTWTSSNPSIVKVSNDGARFGSYCLKLVATSLGNYLHTPSSSDFNFGADDFAIEASIYMLSQNDYHVILSRRANYGSDHAFCFYLRNNVFYFEYTTNGTTVKTASFAAPISLNGWHDVLLTREGADLKLSVNGDVKGVYNIDTDSIYNSSQRIVIGQLNASTAGGYFNGYIDEFRVTKGLSRPSKLKFTQFSTAA